MQITFPAAWYAAESYIIYLICLSGPIAFNAEKKIILMSFVVKVIMYAMNVIEKMH